MIPVHFVLKPKIYRRSPKDRFIVKDEITTDTVDWGAVNKPFEEDQYQLIKKRSRLCPPT
jgi:phosphoenolpyruvate carboxykinase (ATP)